MEPLTGPEARALIEQIETACEEMRQAILTNDRRKWALASTRFEVLSAKLTEQTTIPLES